MRQKWIDNAKGIAIILVIIGHVSGELTGIWDFSFVYGIHLVMFFLLSGYTLKKKVLSIDYINEKFRRLMIPYFYTCVAIMAMDVFNSYLLNADISIVTITKIIGNDMLRSFFASGAITNFGAIDVGSRIGAIWFLPAMFFALVLFQILFQLTDDDKKLGFYSGGIALFGYISARFIWLPFSLQSAMMATFFLWMGYEIKTYQILEKVKWYHYLIAQIILLLGIFLGYCDVGFVVAYLNDIFLSVVVGLGGCLIIYLLANVDRNGRLLSYIGRISLIVLCTHLFALETMGDFFNKILNVFLLKGNARVGLLIILEVLFAVVAGAVIEHLKNVFTRIHESLKYTYGERSENDNRDTAIDITKGIFICAMLVGHFGIDGRLRSVIYSCHMIAFVFFSGYFFKQSDSILKSLGHLIKTFLLPYSLFVFGILILDCNKWSVTYFANTIKQYLLGISFSNKLFTDAISVGPVYFILLLFVVRLIYLIVDHIVINETYKQCLVIVISLIGFMLGRYGYWLPWSVDIACYALIFYELGVLCNKYHILNKVRDSSIFYFLLSPVWVYMIYAGSMEIAIRNYGGYGIVILGSIAGVMIIYMLSIYLLKSMPVFASVLECFGKATVYILIIHTMMGGMVGKFVAKQFSEQNIVYMICSIIIQLIIALGIQLLVKKAKKMKICCRFNIR